MPAKTLGIIAGSGQFPILLARAARSRGYRVVAVALRGETAPELEAEVEAMTWIHLGQLGKLLSGFKRMGAQEVVMCGAITKTRMFRDVRPDLKAVTVAAKLRHFADDGLLRALCRILEDEGLKVVPGQALVPEILAGEGCYTKREPTGRELMDAKLGWRVAGELGRLDVGQCVVVRDRTVLALEAIEGTDACIRRGGALGKERAVVVKRCKPIQDQRFDLPTVGVTTIEVMAEVGATCLVIEAGRSLVFDREQMVARAQASDICVVAWSTQEDEQS